MKYQTLSAVLAVFMVISFVVALPSDMHFKIRVLLGGALLPFILLWLISGRVESEIELEEGLEEQRRKEERNNLHWK